MFNNIKLQHQDKSNFTKAVAAGLLLIVIGCFVFYVSLVKKPAGGLFKKEYLVHIYPYSIDFTKSDSGKTFLFKLSPRDDYYYQGSFKDHFINQQDFKKNRNYLEESLLLIERIILGNRKLVWHVEGNITGQLTKADYMILDKKNGNVQIIRRLNTNTPIYAIGQTITVCNTCMITDENKRAYFNGELLSDEKLSMVEKINFSPLIVSKNQSISFISKIIIIDETGKTLLTFPVDKNQEVFFDEKYHLIEFKTFLNKGNKSVSQAVEF